jgi:ankyrin repeat protein
MPLDMKDKFGQTPVHAAARNREIKALVYLHYVGMNFNIKDNSNKTPLDSVPLDEIDSDKAILFIKNILQNNQFTDE